MLDIQHNGKTVIIPITVDGYGTQNGLSIDSNAITSIYGKNNLINGIFQEALNKELNGKDIGIYYMDKNKATALLQTPGLQLPNHLFRNNGYIHSIRENNSKVKPRLKNVTYSQQFKDWFGDWENDPENASKVVNDDGTPKIVYHGTSNGGFNSFDTYGSNFGLFGNGSYFTESENVAKSYTNKGKGNNKQVYSVYLDIKIQAL